jgi:hypothetical protein
LPTGIDNSEVGVESREIVTVIRYWPLDIRSKSTLVARASATAQTPLIPNETYSTSYFVPLPSTVRTLIDHHIGSTLEVMAWVAKIVPCSVASGILRFTRILPKVPFSPVTVKAVGTPSESRPGQVAFAPLIKTPETIVEDFLAGIEIDGAGDAASACFSRDQQPSLLAPGLWLLAVRLLGQSLS